MQTATPENAGEPLEANPAERLGKLPRELGILLVSVGAVGTILPGIVGAPAILAGGLVLWPAAFGRVEGWLRRTCPEIHRQGFHQIGRFLDDLGNRYPWAE
jgi:hypothetical protein